MIPHVVSGQPMRQRADDQNKIIDAANDFHNRRRRGSGLPFGHQGAIVTAQNASGERINSLTVVTLDGLISEPHYTSGGITHMDGIPIHKAVCVKSFCECGELTSAFHKPFGIALQTAEDGDVFQCLISGVSLAFFPDEDGAGEMFDYLADIGGSRQILTANGSLSFLWVQAVKTDADRGVGRWATVILDPTMPHEILVELTLADDSNGNAYDWIEQEPNEYGVLTAKDGGRSGTYLQGMAAYIPGDLLVDDGTFAYIRPGKTWQGGMGSGDGAGSGGGGSGTGSGCGGNQTREWLAHPIGQSPGTYTLNCGTLTITGPT